MKELLQRMMNLDCAVRTLSAAVRDVIDELEAMEDEPAPAVETGFEYLPEGALEKLRAVGLEPLREGEKADGDPSVLGWRLYEEALEELLQHKTGWRPNADDEAGVSGIPLLLFRRKQTP